MRERRLVEAIGEAAVQHPEGHGYPCIPSQVLREISSRFNLAPRLVSAVALENAVIPLRYAKNIGTLGTDGQARLLRSRAAVIGAGGIGGRAAELLCRIGVGNLVIVDPDTFDETNLNRQEFSGEGVLGMAKVDVVAKRLMEINPDIEVAAQIRHADEHSLPEILRGASVAIDGLDNLDDRLVLQNSCRQMNVVMVHGAIAGDYLQIMTIYPGEPGIEGFYKRAESGEKARGIEVETGNPPAAPALAAAIQVQEAVKVLLESGGTLRGRMLYVDMDDWMFDFIDL